MDIFKNKSAVISAIAAILLYIGSIFVLRQFDLTPQSIHAFTTTFGYYGIIALFFVQLLASLTPVPDLPIAILGVVLYGPYTGSAIIYFAMLFAAVLHYLLAKKLGKNFILKHIPELEPYAVMKNDFSTFVKLILIRNFALVSFDVSAYIAGMTNVNFFLFLASVIIGLLPVLVGNVILAQGIIASTWLMSFFILIAYGAYILAIFLIRRFFKSYKI